MSSKPKNNDDSATIENRKARYEYEVSDTLECGIVLFGSEVKSVRDGKVSLAEGYVRADPKTGELLLYSVNIGEYGPAGPAELGRGHKPVRARKLLAHKREIAKLIKQTAIKGMTIVPLKMYFKEGWAKVLIGVAKGKSKYDKRQSIGKREAQRDIARALSKRA
ncbi:MAG: SsrA-binding protein SmpB [Planctomycetota bacterium]|nr:SsrA-binding protein SmpB [Planctomycetota bacterium]